MKAAGVSARVPAGCVHFIIGAMKCGTTSLYDSLIAHPQVCPARIKEPGFFSHGEVFQRGVDWYREQWPEWNPEVHTVALDATTSYAKSPRFSHSPGLIHAFNPAARLIYLVRDPFERIRSQYMMSIVKDWLLTPLDEGVASFALDVSRYYFQLQQYRAYFPKESLLVMDLADLSDDPAQSLSRICDHLGLSDSTGLSLKKLHVSEVDYGALCLEKSNGDPARYTLSEKNRRQIRGMLEPDMKNLRREYGIDVGRWGFP